MLSSKNSGKSGKILGTKRAGQTPRILPERNRANGRFLTGQGPQGFLSSGRGQARLGLFSSRRRGAR
jgi:hypothetical protein